MTLSITSLLFRFSRCWFKNTHLLFLKFTNLRYAFSAKISHVWTTAAAKEEIAEHTKQTQ